MSGTSMDGIDAVLVDFARPQPVLIGTHSHQWPNDIQQDLIKARDIADEQLHTLATLDLQTAAIFAEACSALLKKTNYPPRDIIAIGNHGQTMRHRPDIDKPFSLHSKHDKIPGGNHRRIRRASRLGRSHGICLVSLPARPPAKR